VRRRNGLAITLLQLLEVALPDLLGRAERAPIPAPATALDPSQQEQSLAPMIERVQDSAWLAAVLHSKLLQVRDRRPAERVGVRTAQLRPDPLEESDVRCDGVLQRLAAGDPSSVELVRRVDDVPDEVTLTRHDIAWKLYSQRPHIALPSDHGLSTRRPTDSAYPASNTA